MSHLRAPAARADRREGGRHGRPGGRTPAPPLPETHIRAQLVRIAVLPAVAVALSACAAVLFTVRAAPVRTGPALWLVLTGAAAVTAAGLVIAAVAANRAARAVTDRLAALRRGAGRDQADLRALVEALRRGDTPPRRRAPAPATAPADSDDFDLLAHELAKAHDTALTAVHQAAQLSGQAGSEQKVEVFVNLARRLQSLVHREISILDELENEVEDPELLKGLFHVDHLATRIRRHAENLAVLGGAVSRRQWSNPVSVHEVLRSAIAEVEQYSRVRLVPPIDGTVRGHAVADVVHLMAELVENATVFSAPHTQVLLRVNPVTSGLAVEVEDRGLGMPVGEQKRMNDLLADPDQVNVASLLRDGRIGLLVVSQLAHRHGIAVRLQTNIYGGVQAVLVLPQDLLGGDDEQPPAARPRRAPALAAGAPGPTPASTAPHSGAPAAPGAVTDPQHQQAEATHPGHRPPAGAPRQHGHANGHPTGAPAPAPTGPTPAAPAATHPSDPATPHGHVPLPVRTHTSRPNPAEAPPGPRPGGGAPGAGDRPVAPLVPRNGTVRGTMGRPQLPKRQAQEHLAPQLREGPGPRCDDDQYIGHDPGLMAAFQRGIGLAEAQNALDPAPQRTPAPPQTPAPRPVQIPGPDLAPRRDGSTPAG
ncbi:sensor histidine kinase [Streptomyces sp. NPDC091292]|uniref:sensor histidine kinase n=1 Tax=Streptomyces sp. NPDC091292 TaxID=3365991 RepID=UPI0037FBEA2B